MSLRQLRCNFCICYIKDIMVLISEMQPQECQHSGRLYILISCTNTCTLSKYIMTTSSYMIPSFIPPPPSHCSPNEQWPCSVFLVCIPAPCSVKTIGIWAGGSADMTVTFWVGPPLPNKMRAKHSKVESCSLAICSPNTTAATASLPPTHTHYTLD